MPPPNLDDVLFAQNLTVAGKSRYKRFHKENLMMGTTIRLQDIPRLQTLQPPSTMDSRRSRDLSASGDVFINISDATETTRRYPTCTRHILTSRY
jgi:hypothetical protein